MSYVFGPLTDTLGESLTTVSDGNGGFILTCPKYGTMAVSAAQLTNPLTADLFERLQAGNDFYTCWRNLSVSIGLGDPGISQLGSPE